MSASIHPDWQTIHRAEGRARMVLHHYQRVIRKSNFPIGKATVTDLLKDLLYLDYTTPQLKLGGVETQVEAQRQFSMETTNERAYGTGQRD